MMGTSAHSFRRFWRTLSPSMKRGRDRGNKVGRVLPDEIGGHLDVGGDFNGDRQLELVAIKVDSMRSSMKRRTRSH